MTDRERPVGARGSGARPRISACVHVILAVAVVGGVASGCAHADRIIDSDGNEVVAVVAAHPEASWLPLQQPLGMHRLDIVVIVDGTPALATVDTGATHTSMSLSMAQRLGLEPRFREATERLRLIDAHGEEGEARRVVVDSLALGNHWLENVDVWVHPGERDSFLIGMDHLQRHEVYLDIEQGFVGLFAPGTGPRGSDFTIPLRIEDNSLVVDVTAPGRSAEARTSLIVDTGAESTMFPSAPAVMAGVDADLRFKDTTIGVLSTRQQEGRFRIDHLRVGDVDVGAVLAFEDISGGGQGPGLLGVDVLGRFRTLIVTSGPAPALHLWRRPGRPLYFPRGPGNAECRGGCVRAILLAPDDADELLADIARMRDDARRAIDRAAAAQLQGDDGSDAPTTSVEDRPRVLVPSTVGRADRVCLSVDIDAVYADKRVELVITDNDDAPGGRLAGHALTLVVNKVPADGYTACLPLPPATAVLGLTSSTPLSLRFVRTDAAVVYRCDGDVCLNWTGP